LVGGYLQGEAAQGAAETSADAQLQAARIAADAAKFRPMGVTTNFGASRFGYDDKGNLNSARYDLSPDLRSQQEGLMMAAGGGAAPNYADYFETPGTPAVAARRGKASSGLLAAVGASGFYGTPGTPAVAARLPGGQAAYDAAVAERKKRQESSFLSQFTNSQAATAPMGQAAGTMMTLGQGYLGTTPQQQAAKYMQEQQALLAAPRANQLADLRAQLQAQGRGGLAIGGNAGQMAANPEMAAYYNSLQQQDLGMAADATRGGMDYARFGSGMVGAGGDMLSSMYGVQRDAYTPYSTALGGASYIEGLGQNALDQGINIGAKGTAASAQSGMLLGRGMEGAARTMQDVNQISPWGTVLTAGSQMLGNYYQQQQPQQPQQPQQWWV